MKKIAFLTFGCKLNFSETSSISKTFLNDGFELVDFKDQADFYVINSCTVTGNAEKKCKTAIKQAHKRNPHARIAVIGCFSQLRPDELAAFDGVDLVLGNKEKFELIEHLKGIQDDAEAKVAASDLKRDYSFYSSYSSGDRTRSFLKVQDGCDYFCTFCTIPFARGRSRSDTVENTIEVAKEIASSNIKEVILTGINVGDFGKHTDETLLDLLKELEKINGIERIRISSIEPDLLNNDIISLVINSDKFLPHFHIPLQSGCNKILKAMKRKYKRELFAERIDLIKDKLPNAMIAADVIIGFPGETEEDFLDTYNFIRDNQITYAHIFPYSERPGTLAQKMENKIPNNVIKERVQRLKELSDRKKRVFYHDHQGQEFSVLFEGDNHEGYMHGFTENYIRVRTKHNSDLTNTIKKVRLDQMINDECYDITILD
ncbi:MAG: tRNA (N(6)-L-threonylcarbamoyladenosine(37)-C(2))-methylthiotransferase MtaB [Bacteroidetes bacterium]|nr:tRNA (N(6)-L-threonylcarbamoyladenosine(37)-C(2))-methylthiotransferase MtaB [Bacteroidota bacterium]